jgi:hypothetical protein
LGEFSGILLNYITAALQTVEQPKPRTRDESF